MFRTGKTFQQKSFFDHDLSFSPAMQKMLKKSWAGNFFETIFLAIQDIEKEPHIGYVTNLVEVRDKEKNWTYSTL